MALPYIKPDPGHLNCSSCSTYNTPGCTTCHKCTRCCKCSACGECGSRHVRSRCNRCGHCKRGGQCQCARRPAAINVPEHAMHAQEPQDIQRFKSAMLSTEVDVDILQRPVSIEVELSNWTGKHELETTSATGHASRHRDGSVHGLNPTELILGPLMPHQIAPAVDNYATWAPKVRASVNSTCGLHVHVGTQGFDGYSLRRLVQLWRVLEPSWYNLTTRDRAGNKFCYTWPAVVWQRLDALHLDNLSESGDMKLAVACGIYGITPPKVWDSTSRRLLSDAVTKWANTPHGSGSQPRVFSRYYGLNLHSHYYRGTVEFRMHHGTADPARIAGWTQWCGWLVEMASRLGDSEVAQITDIHQYISGQWHRGYGMLTLPDTLKQWYLEAPKGEEVQGPPAWDPDAVVPKGHPVIPPQDRAGQLRFQAQVNMGNIMFDNLNNQWIQPNRADPVGDQINQAFQAAVAADNQ